MFYNEDTKKWELFKPFKTIKIDCMTEEDYEKIIEWLKKYEHKKPIPAKTKIDFVSVYKCPHCGKVSKNKKSPNGLYHNKGLGCSCSDGISYPNKFSYELLSQLPVTNVIHEYNPHWLKPYRYDNYFEFDGDKYILEMDGNLGHGN